MTNQNDDFKPEEPILNENEEEIKTEKKSKFDEFIDSAKGFVKDAKLQEKFDVLKEKTEEVVESAAKKIDEIRKDEELKEKLNKVKENVVDATEKVVDKIKENEELTKTLTNIKDTTVDVAKRSAGFVSEKIEEIRENPDVQRNVEKAKDKTIDIAEKAVDGLKKWLRPEEVAPNDEPANETVVEEDEVKEA